MKHLMFLCIILSCSCLVQAQVYFQIDTSDGLSENNVRDLIQLPDGRMVVTTNGLINIYNGTNFFYLHFRDNDIYPLTSYEGYHHSYLDESGRLWMKIHHGLILVDTRKDQVASNLDEVFRKMGLKDAVTNFFMDDSKNLWFVTRDDRLFVYDVKKKKTSLFLSHASFDGKTKDPLSDLALIDGQLLLFYDSGIHVSYDYATKRKLRVNTEITELVAEKYNGTNFVIPRKHSFLQMKNGVSGGILMNYQLKTHTWELVLKTNYWLNTLVFNMDESFKVCCKNGLWYISRDLKHKHFVSDFKTMEGTTLSTEISTIYQDNEGGTWIGTLDRGLLYYHPKRYLFKNSGKTLFGESGLSGINVRGFAMADADHVLVGTNKGLFEYNLRTSEISLFNGMPMVDCRLLVTGKGDRVWVCTRDKGLFSFQKGRVIHYELPWNTINSVFECPDGRLALCPRNGIILFNPLTGKTESVQPVDGLDLTAVKQLSALDDKQLLGLDSENLFLVNWDNKSLSLVKEPGIGKSSRYNSLYVDHRGWVWIATQDGLRVWNPNDNQIKQIHAEEGLVNNSVQSVFEDSRQTIWVTTAGGVSHILVSDEFLRYSIENYNRFDGIIQGEFLPCSHLITPSGELFIGGIDGFNRVNLNSLYNKMLPELTPLFVGLKVNDIPVICDSLYNGNRILKQSITSTKELLLKHSQNFITLEFSALDYINSTYTRYRYMLQGVDNQWHEISTKDGMGRASYTNLPPGTYHFYVRASYNGINWENGKMISMLITILHPWWSTPLAYFMYAVLISIMLYIFISYSIKKSRQRMLRQQKEKMDEMKYRFFTNVSHEIRTPLTLIITPLGALLRDLKDEKLKTKLTSIYKNAQELLMLINQLLDFRRIEMKGECLNLTYGDFVQLLEDMSQSFETLAEEKGIRFTCSHEVTQLYAYFDKDKMRKVLNNVLFNAFKFTEQGGEIVLLASLTETDDKGQVLSIVVKDTGCGISKEDLPHIFERFYQTHDGNNTLGSGIGLHLVKEYVLLHGGEISVQSEPQNGTKFTILIPSTLKTAVEHPFIDVSNTLDQKNEPEEHVNKHVHTLLLVEDNDDFVRFMKEELESHYSIIIASDGVEGEEMAISYAPDLIISDVMMPRRDGLELCRNLKKDIRTSHIPFILLTAYSSNDKELFGYKSGADDFISKPFRMEILLLKIQKLIREQDERKALFTKKIEIKPSELAITTLDEDLIHKAIDCVEKNMDNDYGVERFSLDMNMERTVLYRKLQSVVGLSPSEFIRTIRLKRAAQLLASRKYSVTEVAGMVGFATPKYFTKYFTEAFGVLPSQYGIKSDSDEHHKIGS